MRDLEDREFRELLLQSEVDECADNLTCLYWKYTALSKTKVWRIKISWKLIYLGTDEYWRRTLILGPFVIALWDTVEGKLVRARLKERLDTLYKDSFDIDNPEW